jgi:hypothetical protein
VTGEPPQFLLNLIAHLNDHSIIIRCRTNLGNRGNAMVGISEILIVGAIQELRSYLTCGILCFGFGRASCASCGQGFVVASRLSRVWRPWEPLAFPSAARQDGAMDGPPCL